MDHSRGIRARSRVIGITSSRNQSQFTARRGSGQIHRGNQHLRSASLWVGVYPTCVCEVSAVGKISNCDPGESWFNPRPGRGLNLSQTSLPHRPGRGTLNRWSRDILGEVLALLDKSRVIPMLWSFN